MAKEASGKAHRKGSALLKTEPIVDESEVSIIGIDPHYSGRS